MKTLFSATKQPKHGLIGTQYAGYNSHHQREDTFFSLSFHYLSLNPGQKPDKVSKLWTEHSGECLSARTASVGGNRMLLHCEYLQRSQDAFNHKQVSFPVTKAYKGAKHESCTDHLLFTFSNFCNLPTEGKIQSKETQWDRKRCFFLRRSENSWGKACCGWLRLQPGELLLLCHELIIRSSLRRSNRGQVIWCGPNKHELPESAWR